MPNVPFAISVTAINKRRAPSMQQPQELTSGGRGSTSAQPPCRPNPGLREEAGGLLWVSVTASSSGGLMT